MEERSNKTIICSVFFLDIVEYSKKSVSGQISQKERFNAFLSTAIRDVPADDRIILDTGDGAAISFLGDVEDALRAALSMRSSLLSEEGAIDPPLLVRMGVNLGPVRLVRDINGQPNIVGDGINVAQRVMGFAEPGQILVSRSYYDAASRLSSAYAGMFHYEGSRTDKHVREHEVYAIGYPGDLTGAQKKAHDKVQAESGSGFSGAYKRVFAKSAGYWDALYIRYNGLISSLNEKFKQASTTQKSLYVGLAVIPLLLLLLLLKMFHNSTAPVQSSPQVAELPVPAASLSNVPVAASASVVASNVAKPAVAAHEPKPVAHAKPENKEKKAQKPDVKKDDKKLKPENKKDDKQAKHEAQSGDKSKAKAGDKAKRNEHAAATTAEVTLTVKPWGEVYLDGKMVDVSPPLTKLQVLAGVHVVELKNANFPVYKKTINVKAGDKLSISYKFAN